MSSVVAHAQGSPQPEVTPDPAGEADETDADETDADKTDADETDAASDAPAADVKVVGRSAAVALKRSAYTVTVVDTDEARRSAADLGDVLARKTPVAVQRVGGLGSRGTFSLGGMGGERLRFYLDAVPLELMGYLSGPGNVPVNLVDRVEVYQGMVPIRLAGDALGGAVNLVTDQQVRESTAAASYQLGSFGTHRMTLSSRYAHQPSGFFARASGFFDAAENDYDVQVTTWDAMGRLRPATVPLFHNGYRGIGTTVAVGVADRSWAERLVLQGIWSVFDNDIQNGLSMAQPYGEVSLMRGSWGANLKYVQPVSTSVRLEAIAGYTRTDARFRDVSRCFYDWRGNCTPRAVDAVQGEISGRPVDREIIADIWFARSTLTVDLADDHQARLTLAPTFTDRRGEDLTRSQGYDPLEQPRRLLTGVAGVELESHLFDRVVKNVLSAKGYLLATDSQRLLPTGDWEDISRTIYRGGIGDSLHVRISRALSLKVSYEYALRLPSADELYGDGNAVLESLELRPETSHNITSGAAFAGNTPAGRFTLAVDGFARFSEDFIAPLATVDFVRNVNIWGARALGVEGRLGWTVPQSDWLSIDGRITYQDLRNRSTTGELAAQSGDRIPNVPYLFADGGVQLRGRDLLMQWDTLELAYSTRYVHAYLRGWESLARNADRLTIDAQLTHRLALLYAVELSGLMCTATVEAQNLTDEGVFDFYGLQRPGRSFHTKFTIQF